MMRQLMCLGLLLVPLIAWSQSKGPNESDIKEAIEKFKIERTEAAKKFSPDSIKPADETIKKAEEALKDGSLKDAARLTREARWQLPYVPSDLPENVERVIGLNRMRHNAKANKVVFAGSNQQVLSASDDGTVRLWDLGNGREVRRYSPSKEKARGLAATRDGKLFAVTYPNEIHLVKTETMERVHLLKGHEGVIEALVFSEDGTQLVSGGDDTSIRLWNVADGKAGIILNPDYKTDKEGSYKQVSSLSISKDGKFILSGDAGGNIRVWDPSKPEEKRIVTGIEAHRNGRVTSVLFGGGDSKVIFSCGADGIAMMHPGYDPSGKEIGFSTKKFDSKAGGSDAPLTAMAVTADGNYMLTGSVDTSIRVWDIKNGRVIRIYPGHTATVNAIALSPDDRTFVSVSDDQSVKLWTLAVADEHDNFDDHKGIVWSAALSPNGKLIASGGADRVIIIRETRGGKILHRLEGHTAAITKVAFSPKGDILASASGDSLVKLWDVKTGALIRDLKAATKPVMAIAFSDDGNFLLTGGIDKKARLYDVTKETPPIEFPENRSAISTVTLRKGGKFAVVGSADGQIRCYDLTAAPKESGTPIVAHTLGVYCVLFDPDGKRLATSGGDGSVKIWTVPPMGTPSLEFELKPSNKPTASVQFSADGRLLVCAGSDAIIRIFDLNDKKEIRSLRGHSDWVSSVAFNNSGSNILSCSVDKTVKLWEIASDEAAKGVGHSGPVTAVALSPDGKLAASGSEDRTIRIWNTDNGAELFVLGRENNGHRGKIIALAFDSTAKKLISTGEDNKLLIWNVETGRLIREINDVERIPVVVTSPKKDKFVIWNYHNKTNDDVDNSLRVFDYDGKRLSNLLEKGGKVACIGFSSDCEAAVIGFNDGAVRIWKLDPQERIGGDWIAFNEGVGDIGITSDKSKVIAADPHCKVKIYDVAGKKELKEIETFKAVGDTKPTLAGLLVSPDGKYFSVLDATGGVKLFKVEDGSEVRSWKLPSAVNSLAFNADSTKIITANADGTLMLLSLPK
ncbi:MAG: hypothetical protein N2112_06680 [Gemmataceae bacterium]|nr:hypothetical protein [Gemmataceae bacterium]